MLIIMGSIRNLWNFSKRGSIFQYQTRIQCFVTKIICSLFCIIQSNEYKITLSNIPFFLVYILNGSSHENIVSCVFQFCLYFYKFPESFIPSQCQSYKDFQAVSGEIFEMPCLPMMNCMLAAILVSEYSFYHISKLDQMCEVQSSVFTFVNPGIFRLLISVHGDFVA